MQDQTYFLASFPGFSSVNYVRLPDPTWRPLILGLISPTVVCTDQQNMRVFVADNPAGKVYWYQLKVLDGNTLVTAGPQRIAMNAFVARGLAVDSVGSLYAIGQASVLPPLTSTDALVKQDAVQIATSSTGVLPLDPIPVWTIDNTGAPALLSAAAPIALDAFNLYWGNQMEGTTRGVIVKGGKTVPGVDPVASLNPMANNVDSITSLALTPSAVFYGAPGAIYGVAKNKVGALCGTGGASCPLVSDAVQEPTGIVWDGDGTMYVADSGGGVLYSFASGSIGKHKLEKVVDASGIFDFDLIQIGADTGNGSGAHRSTPGLPGVAGCAVVLVSIVALLG